MSARKEASSGLVLRALALGWCRVYTSSSYGTSAGVAPVQPIPFSHQHHAGILGIDCRYCHTTVESSPFAGMPATEICMNCHSQMWVGSRCSRQCAKAIGVTLDPLGACIQHARLCLFRSQHSRPKGNRLLIVSWSNRSDALYVPGSFAIDEMVPRLSSRSGTTRAATRMRVRHQLPAAGPNVAWKLS